jgi:FAD/FMN-containing dehydrogenase
LEPSALAILINKEPEHYDRQRPPLFAEALRAAKKALDPQGLLNPGVLIDP